MTTDLVWLAVLMGAVTYPSRALPLLAPGMHRLPIRVQEYLRLVGPAVLATLAAVNVMVALDPERHPSFHIGIEWLAVGACVVLVAARRGLLVGLVAAAALAALARASGAA
ncbi:MAG TPA: AzlD domain-containing protein [Candidatus Sulfomarinibacteraceae bacterium]|nr:AzlD domain-containing protein [Candidatus Sulfomarinibacteraceae bacterium]